MGIFDRFRKRDEEITSTPTNTSESLTPPVDDVLLKALIENEAITKEKAMTLPSVAGAVDFICSMVASMPVKLYKYKQGKVEEQENDSRVKLLNGDTGDTLDAYQWKYKMVEDYLMDKGAYSYIQKSRNEVIGLYYVEPIYITIMKNYKPIYKDYDILVEGEAYKPYEFIKLLRKTKDGSTGNGVTKEVSKALETAYQTLLYQLGLVKTGGNKKGFLKSDHKLGNEELDALKKGWKRMYGNNETNMIVLNKGIDFQEASNSSVEMQLNESKKTLQDEINNIFHIKPDFYDTFKEAIYPIIRAFETALNRDLLLEKEKKNYFFEFDVKEIIKANVLDRYNAYKIAKETGWLTLNEIRKMENKEYIEGLDVVNVGLGAVLYDTNTHKYYTPNTDAITELEGTTPSEDAGDLPDEKATEGIKKVLLDKELDTEFEQDGNSSL